MNDQNRKNTGRGNRPRTDEFDQVIIEIARVTRVMAGGKRMRFRACVVVGDRRGAVGMAIAKGADVTMAVNKAATKARKNLITVSMKGGTIPHRVDAKFGAARLLLKPAPKGSGVIAGGAVRPVLELAGISDIVAKNLGSKNKINTVSATLRALAKLKRVVEKKTDHKKNPTPSAPEQK